MVAWDLTAGGSLSNSDGISAAKTVATHMFF